MNSPQTQIFPPRRRVFDVTIQTGDRPVGWKVPAALTELWARTVNRSKFDLSDLKEARLVVRKETTAEIAGAEFRGQYSTDESSWNYLDSATGGTGPSVGVDVTNTTLVSAWVVLEPGARDDVFLRIVGINGNGFTTSNFGRISLQFR